MSGTGLPAGMDKPGSCATTDPRGRTFGESSGMGAVALASANTASSWTTAGAGSHGSAPASCVATIWGKPAATAVTGTPVAASALRTAADAFAADASARSVMTCADKFVASKAAVKFAAVVPSVGEKTKVWFASSSADAAVVRIPAACGEPTPAPRCAWAAVTRKIWFAAGAGIMSDGGIWFAHGIAGSQVR